MLVCEDQYQTGPMLLLNTYQTRQHLSFEELIPALRRGFTSSATVPMRHTHAIEACGARGTSLIMPAWSESGYYGVKIVNIFPDNRHAGLPALHSTYVLHDARTGVPLALLDGNEITSHRTAAASALAASFLSPERASRLLIVGCGRVGRLVAPAMRTVRPIRQVRLWDIDPQASFQCAQALIAQGFDVTVVDELEPAVRVADIVSCATLATAPLIQGEWLAPGSHLDLIGSFTPDMQEADPSCFAGAAVYVDTTEATVKSGDLLRAFAAATLAPAALCGDLAGLCAGTVSPLCRQGQRTVFKAVGTALEDLVAATMVYNCLTSSA